MSTVPASGRQRHFQSRWLGPGFDGGSCIKDSSVLGILFWGGRLFEPPGEVAVHLLEPELDCVPVHGPDQRRRDPDIGVRVFDQDPEAGGEAKLAAPFGRQESGRDRISDAPAKRVLIRIPPLRGERVDKSKGEREGVGR